MFAVFLDENNYLQSYSSKFRKPGSVLVESIPEETDAEKLHCYQYKNNKFVFDAKKWAAIEAEREEMARNNEIMQEIFDLKAEIESSDYQIIKCYEYSLMHLEMPYDVEQLHAERQALRDQINALEVQLNTKG